MAASDDDIREYLEAMEDPDVADRYIKKLLDAGVRHELVLEIAGQINMKQIVVVE